MASDSVLVDKCLRFSVRMVKLYKYLTEEQKEYVLSKQLLRSATSIGANSNEAVYAASRNDFINKMHIDLKETAETEYWLKLIAASEYIDKKLGDSFLYDCIEIKKMLIAISKTAKTDGKETDNR